jgi:hypothetical protein
MNSIKTTAERTDSTVAPRSVHETRQSFGIGALVAVAVTLGFFLLFWNRFAGIRSGLGGFGGGMALLQGLMPYRDYFTAAPPMFVFTSAAALKLFGGAIAVTRGFGVFERLVIALLVYAWLSRFFAGRHALVAAIVTMIASAGDYADPISSYNHETILWAIASGFAASFALDWDQSSIRRAAVCSAASGLLAGLSFATKQTMGLGATVFIPFVVSLCLLRTAGIRRAAAFAMLFAAGWAVAAGALLLWLSHLGIVHEFFADVFQKGPAAKGANPVDFLARDLLVATALRIPAIMGLIALLLSWPALRRSSAAPQEEHADSTRNILWLGGVCAVCIGAGAAASYVGVISLPSFTAAASYFDLFATLALMIYYAAAWLRAPLSRREAQFCLLATVSFGMAFMVSLSWPIFEAMLLPGIGFLIAACLDGFNGWRRNALYVLCAALLVTGTCLKLNIPFGFSGFGEPPVSTATQASAIPELRGLRLPPAIVQFIDGTARIVEEHSTAADTIFTYPEMGIFYSVTHRHPPTLSGSHNIDVVNDDFAREEAKRLVAGRPAVLIYWREPEAKLFSDDAIWRNGRPSGQHDIIKAMETLASQYQLAATYHIPPGDKLVSIYVRP